jgi:hypothetical protein
MPQVESKTPAKLRPYEFHGVQLNWEDGKEQAVGDCPWCGKEGKFVVLMETGQWRCFVCNEGSENGKVNRGGNAYTFLRMIWQHSYEQPQAYDNLRINRKFLTDEVLHNWGVCKSAYGYPNWLIPGYNHEGKLVQLYRYIKDAKSGKYRLIPTPEMGQHLHGVNLLKPNAKVIYICEGPWDGMALYEALAYAKRNPDDGRLSLTSVPDMSLLGGASVIAVPGCNVFNESWLPLFEGKDVILLYDNDYARLHNGRLIESAGYAGMKRVASILNSNAEFKPDTIRFLRWGDNGFDRALPSGFDVRDFLSRGTTPATRVFQLNDLLKKVVPIPEDWIQGRTKEATKKGSTEMECLPCSTWNDLVLVWRKALKWTEGLDRSLSVMLACVTSTKAVGDQLWIKVIGPAACAGFNTPIYDPVTSTTHTLGKRFQLGQKFSVYTRHEDGTIGIAQALPPKKLGRAPMYQVTFKSGRQIEVTAAHKFWNGDTYVPLSDLISSKKPLRLPSISAQCLKARSTGDLYEFQTELDFLSHCENDFCLCGEQSHEIEGNLLCGSPSQVCAQQCISSCMGALEERQQKCTLQLNRRDTSHSPLHASLLLCGGGSLHPAYVSDNESPEPLFSFGEQPQQPKHQLRTNLQEFVFVQVSSGSPTQHRCQQGPYQHEPGQPSVLEQSQFEGHQLHTILDKGQFSPETTRALQKGETLQPSPSSSGVERQGLCSSPCTVQPLSSQQDIGQQDIACEPETSLHEQPSYTSISINDFRLGPLTLTETDEIVNITCVGEADYYDFHVPLTNNYWACGVFNHNCGKSTLCEALSINKDYVLAKSTMRGFHSGYKSDRDGEEDHSLIPLIMGKTLVTKDGDTLLSSPNRDQILSEARDLYDSVSRTHYRHGMNRDYEGVRMTWILCGTNSLRELDSSELGERFLDCVVVDRVEDELEDEILLRKAHQADRCLNYEADGKAETHHDPDLVAAMQLTGGYISYLRQNAQKLLSGVHMSDEARLKCIHYAKFVAHLRARPSKVKGTKQDESSEREFATRLTSQIVRLAKCLAVVLNRKTVDVEVLRRTKCVATDTARGTTLDICRQLARAGTGGQDVKALALYVHQTEDAVRKLLRFLRRIAVTEPFTTTGQTGAAGSQRNRWRLTKRMMKLYNEVYSEELEES